MVRWEKLFSLRYPVTYGGIRKLIAHDSQVVPNWNILYRDLLEIQLNDILSHKNTFLNWNDLSIISSSTLDVIDRTILFYEHPYAYKHMHKLDNFNNYNTLNSVMLYLTISEIMMDTDYMNIKNFIKTGILDREIYPNFYPLWEAETSLIIAILLYENPNFIFDNIDMVRYYGIYKSDIIGDTIAYIYFDKLYNKLKF